MSSVQAGPTARLLTECRTIFSLAGTFAMVDKAPKNNTEVYHKLSPIEGHIPVSSRADAYKWTNLAICKTGWCCEKGKWTIP